MAHEELLDIYTDYLIYQNQHATAAGLSLLLDGLISHDKITRFLNSNEFESKDFWQYVKPQVRRLESETDGGLILWMMQSKKSPTPMKTKSFVVIFHTLKVVVSRDSISCRALYAMRA